MAKPELRDHRKFIKLCRILNAPIPHVMGYLDCLWTRGYQTGNPFIGDADDVEGAAMFPGERGTFAKAAFEAGFIDLDEKGNFIIHDLYDHAPKYAKMRIERAGHKPKPAQMSPARSQTCPAPAQMSPARSQKGQFISKNGTNEPVTVPPKPNQNQNPKSPPTPPSGGALIENAKFAVSGDKNTETISGHGLAGDNAADAKPDATGSILKNYNDPIFDAIAEITGRDKVASRGILVPVWRSIVEAEYTAEEVREFGRRFRELLPSKKSDRPTPGEVRNNIGLIRAKPIENNSAGIPKSKYRQQLDIVAEDLLNGVEPDAGKIVLSLPAGGQQ